MSRVKRIFSAAVNLSPLKQGILYPQDHSLQKSLTNRTLRDCVVCTSLRMASSKSTNSSVVSNSCSNSLTSNGSSSSSKDLLQLQPSLLDVNSRFRSVVTSPKMVDVGRNMDDHKLLSKDERQEFMSLFPSLVSDLVEKSETRDMEETNQWLARVLQYNVPHGKRNRGLATALAYRYMVNELTDDNVRLSYVLGWCTEMLQAFFLVADDIMDESETRRGRPCWYKVDNLGVAAVNDSLLLEAAIYELLKKHFRDKDCYLDLMEIFHDITYKTILGQSLDTRTGLERKMEIYDMDRYSGIVKYKTSYYSFYAPVRLAMAMADINDPDLVRQVETVTLEMGHLFQVQDDYLDCFGDVQVTGKIGTDIQDCKCSWLFVIAMQRASKEQQEYLMENYGKHEQEKIDRVKKLYIEMELPNVYHKYEEKTYTMICDHIQQMSPKLPKQLFVDMLLKIYRRSS